MIESGEIDGDFSNIYFLLPAITDWSEEINRYLNKVSISPIEFSQEQLDNWPGTKFDPSKLDLLGLEKNTISDAIIKSLKHVNNISNSNIVRNVNGVLSRREVDVPVVCIW